MFKKLFILFFTLFSLEAAHLEHLTFGLKSTMYDYTEYDTSGKILDTEESNLFELLGVYVNAHIGFKEKKNHLEFLNSVTTGFTKYIGSKLGGNYGDVVSTTSNTFLKSELSFVRVINSSKRSDISILPAIGYHYWERTLSISQNEIYSWGFYQLGLRTDIKKKNKKHLTFEYKHQWTIKPTMYADIPSINLDDDFDLGKTESDFFSITLHHRFFKGMETEMKLEYETVDIGRSNVIKGFVEPQSNQKNISLYFGFMINP